MASVSRAFLVTLLPILQVYAYLHATNFSTYPDLVAQWTVNVTSFIAFYTIAMRGFAASLAQSSLFSYALGSTLSLAKEDEIESEGGSCIPVGHVITTAAQDSRAAKRISKTKTIYYIAHPAPIGHRRPKLILQLQDASTGARLTPAYNVVPARLLAPRLGRRIPTIVKRATGLSENDLVVLHAEDYRSAQDDQFGGPSSSADKDSWLSSNPFGVISHVPDRVPQEVLTEIALSDGSIWHGKGLRNGNYEFVSVPSDIQGECVRWIARKSNPKTSTANSEGIVDCGGRGSRFTFSLINPEVRKHSIIATLDLNTQTLEICDWYNAPRTSSEPALGVPMPTTEHIRSLVILTGTWVALKEGCSNYFTLDSPGSAAMNDAVQEVDKPTVQSPSQLSVAVSQPYSSISGRTINSVAQSSSFASQSSSLKNRFTRHGSKLNPDSAMALGLHANGSYGPPLEMHARTNSTGSAFMKLHSAQKAQCLAVPMHSTFTDNIEDHEDERTRDVSPKGSFGRFPDREPILRTSLSQQHPMSGPTRDISVSEQQWGSPVQDLNGGLEIDADKYKQKHTKGVAHRMLQRFRAWKLKISRRVKRKK